MPDDRGRLKPRRSAREAQSPGGVIGSGAMRSMAIILAVAAGLCACGKGSRDGVEAAKKEAEAEDLAKAKAHQPAKVQQTPVAGNTKIPCSQLIDAAAFQTALGEKEPLAIKDVTKNDRDSSASCALLRGGKRPGEVEQKEILKRDGRLGVLPGDELCNVSAFCSSIEDADRFRKRCTEQADESMGTFACVHVNGQGIDDQPRFRFFDADTKCILEVGGGPSFVSADGIRTCAKIARDTIGPDQIAAGRAPAPEPAPAGSGSGR